MLAPRQAAGNPVINPRVARVQTQNSAPAGKPPLACPPSIGTALNARHATQSDININIDFININKEKIMVHQNFKAAVIQAAPVFMDLQSTLSKTIKLIDEAAANGAKLVAFPETWLPGYPWWLWLGAPAWGLQFVPRYHANAMRVDGPEMDAIGQAAARGNINVNLSFD